MAEGFGPDDFIPTDGTLRVYRKAGVNYNILGVSPDAVGKISVDGVTLTTNSEGAIQINLGNANTWTATQTFPVASFANLLSTANTWTATQTINTEANGGTPSLVLVTASSQAAAPWISFQDSATSPNTTIFSFFSYDSNLYIYNPTNFASTVTFYTYQDNAILTINYANNAVTTLYNTLDDGSGNMSVARSLRLATPQTTITGTTAGSAIASMPEQGSSYKKVIVYLDGYENDSTTAQTYTFPTAFANTPVVSTNSASVPGVTVSTTELSLAPDTTTAYTGWIIVEGY